jgi:hypothetical protein
MNRHSHNGKGKELHMKTLTRLIFAAMLLTGLGLAFAPPAFALAASCCVDTTTCCTGACCWADDTTCTASACPKPS